MDRDSKNRFKLIPQTKPSLKIFDLLGVGIGR